MSRRRFGSRPRAGTDEPGQDSFLDIVANLVGVLIILLVVVGAQAGAAWNVVKPDPKSTSQLDSLQAEVKHARQLEHKVRLDNHELEQKIRVEEQLTKQRKAARDEMLVKLQLVQKQLDDRRDQLDEQLRKRLMDEAAIASLQLKLSGLKKQTTNVEAVYQAPEIIDHYPTPIAKTVFRDEVHFRLSGGKLSLVPLEKLTDLMQTDWDIKQEKLKKSPTIVETVGPINGFRLQYELAAKSIVRQTSAGPMTGQTIEFQRFSIKPVHDGIGEPVNEALNNPSSALIKQVQRMNPQKYTVSIWVYPDSYAEFKQLKTWLYEQGFQTAVWPLSEGSLISGGPNGYRTAAQ